MSNNLWNQFNSIEHGVEVEAFLPKAPLKVLHSLKYQFCLQDYRVRFQDKVPFPLFFCYTHVCSMTPSLCPHHAFSPLKTYYIAALLKTLLYSLIAFGRILVTFGLGQIFLLVTTGGIWVLGFIFILGLSCWAGNQIKTGTSLWFHLLFFPPWDKLAQKSCFETLKFKLLRMSANSELEMLALSFHRIVCTKKYRLIRVCLRHQCHPHRGLKDINVVL